MNIRLLFGIVGLLVAALAVAGCSSISAEDQAYLTAMQSSGAELAPMMHDFSAALNATDFSAISTTGTKVSTRAQFWHDKIAALSVSSKYLDSKNSWVLGLSEWSAGADEWAKAAQLLNVGDLKEASQGEGANNHLRRGNEFLKMGTDNLPK